MHGLNQTQTYQNNSEEGKIPENQQKPTHQPHPSKNLNQHTCLRLTREIKKHPFNFSPLIISYQGILTTYLELKKTTHACHTVNCLAA